MELKKGNTYKLEIPVKSKGELIDINNVTKAVFQFNEIKKEFPSDEVNYNEEAKIFEVYLTQEDTLELKGNVQWEIGIRYNDGTVEKSPVYKIASIDTIIKEVI